MIRFIHKSYQSLLPKPIVSIAPYSSYSYSSSSSSSSFPSPDVVSKIKQDISTSVDEKTLSKLGSIDEISEILAICANPPAIGDKDKDGKSLESKITTNFFKNQDKAVAKLAKFMIARRDFNDETVSNFYHTADGSKWDESSREVLGRILSEAETTITYINWSRTVWVERKWDTVVASLKGRKSNRDISKLMIPYWQHYYIAAEAFVAFTSTFAKKAMDDLATGKPTPAQRKEMINYVQTKVAERFDIYTLFYASFPLLLIHEYELSQSLAHDMSPDTLQEQPWVIPKESILKHFEKNHKALHYGGATGHSLFSLTANAITSLWIYQFNGSNDTSNGQQPIHPAEFALLFGGRTGVIFSSIDLDKEEDLLVFNQSPFLQILQDIGKSSDLGMSVVIEALDAMFAATDESTARRVVAYMTPFIEPLWAHIEKLCSLSTQDFHANDADPFGRISQAVLMQSIGVLLTGHLDPIFSRVITEDYKLQDKLPDLLLNSEPVSNLLAQFPIDAFDSVFKMGFRDKDVVQTYDGKKEFHSFEDMPLGKALIDTVKEVHRRKNVNPDIVAFAKNIANSHSHFSD